MASIKVLAFRELSPNLLHRNHEILRSIDVASLKRRKQVQKLKNRERRKAERNPKEEEWNKAVCFGSLGDSSKAKNFLFSLTLVSELVARNTQTKNFTRK